MFLLIASILLVVAGLYTDKLWLKVACIAMGGYGLFLIVAAFAHSAANVAHSVI